MASSTTHKGRTGAILRYMLMPQILPRIGEFYASGFSQLALLIASVYRAVNILPANHAVFRPENRNHLGLRQVLGAAAAELKYTRSDIDKIIIYFAILGGIVLLAAQFLLVLAYVMMNPALAQGAGMPTTYAGFFETPTYMGCSGSLNKESDVAYQLLYMVFGVPELFNPNCPVRPFHTALYSLLQFYSIGLLVVAVIIASYMIFAILTETAQTGVPFGKRYNQVWAPIRFVFALGLLIPVGYGLNAAQWITLYAAKYGSDFATRGWIIFNETMNDAYLNDSEQRIGWPKVPELLPLAYYMSTMSGCEVAYETLFTGDSARPIEGYLVKNAAEIGGTPPTIQSKSYEDALKFYNNGDILIRFGAYNPKDNSDQLGNTRAWCGDLVIYAGDATEPGAKSMQKFYYDLVVKMWSQDWSNLKQVARFQAKFGSSNQNIKSIPIETVKRPTPKYRQDLANALEALTEKALEEAVKAQRKSNTWKNDAKQIKSRGWGGAGIWYNKIAQINGSLVTAVNNVPQPRAMPIVWQESQANKLKQNTNPDKGGSDKLADGRENLLENGPEKDALEAINAVYNYWTREDMRQDEKANQTRQTNNIIIDVINMIFGTSGLFDMCKSADVHPLAQLSILGKGLVEASIRNLALAVGGSVLAAAQIPFIGVAAGAASKMLLTVASITITLGFILFYVLPFMPFLYFFFAVGGWIKGLFEAMVGVPLWALAHMRIDGEGLPGEAAISGYFMIFEIFLRPIVIVFGLLASVVIFAAMVKVLNEIFYLVVVNLAGHDESSRTLCGQIGNNGGAGAGGSGGGGNDSAAKFFRGPIDELFFTVLYAIIVYMIGMSCFKLIDQVPNNLLRYMNANVATFNDQRDDPAAGLLTRLSIGGRTVFGQVMDIGGKAGEGLAGLGKGAVEIAKSGQPKEGGQ